MQTFIKIALLYAVVLASCKKNNDSTQGIALISGRWELTKEVGGIAGSISYEHGKSIVMTFDNQHQFRFETYNWPSNSGTYTMQPSARPGDWILELRYPLNGTTQLQRDSIRFNGNQLLILPFASCCDIPVAFYQRLE